MLETGSKFSALSSAFVDESLLLLSEWFMLNSWGFSTDELEDLGAPKLNLKPMSASVFDLFVGFVSSDIFLSFADEKLNLKFLNVS